MGRRCIADSESIRARYSYMLDWLSVCSLCIYMCNFMFCISYSFGSLSLSLHRSLRIRIDMCVCIYVYVYLHIYVSSYYTDFGVHIQTYTCMYVCTYIYIYIYMHIHHYSRDARFWTVLRREMQFSRRPETLLGRNTRKPEAYTQRPNLRPLTQKLQILNPKT